MMKFFRVIKKRLGYEDSNHIQNFTAAL